MACQSNQLGGIVSGPRETLNAGKISNGEALDCGLIETPDRCASSVTLVKQAAISMSDFYV